MSQPVRQLFDGRRAKGEESRRIILRSAVSSIAKMGLGSTTLDSVAGIANVSRALVIFHFKSKNQLFKEVLEYLGRRFSEGWDHLVETREGTTMEKILKLVEYDIQFAVDNPEYISAWHAFWGESKGNSLYHELSAPRDYRYEDELERLLSVYIAEEGYDQSELKSITDGLGAMLFGLWVEFHLAPEKTNSKRGLAAVRLFLSKVFPNKPLP
jgi:TetR/AcrR family transcriptional repressor of bet genes